MDLEGKLAVITGAANGIGKAIAIHFAMNGCKLALVDIDIDSLDKLQQNLRGLFLNTEIHSFVTDVSQRGNITSLVDTIKNKFNTSCIQLLFNNVGLSSLTTNILDGDISNLQKIMDVNVWSIIYGTQLFLPLLLNNDPSIDCYIVNTGSLASIQSADSMYSITKHAVLAISETMERELKFLYRQKYGKDVKCNILVSTLCPGFVKNTNLLQTSADSLDDLSYGELEREIKKKNVRKRVHAINSSMPNMGIFNAAGIEANEVAKCLFKGLRERRTVIHTEMDWAKAAIQDRKESILNGRPNDAKYMKMAIKETIKKRSKL